MWQLESRRGLYICEWIGMQITSARGNGRWRVENSDACRSYIRMGLYSVWNVIIR